MSGTGAARQFAGDANLDARLNTVVQVADNLSVVPGEEARVVALANEALESAQRSGKSYYEAYARRVLAFCALERGDVLQAEIQALQALRLAHAQRDTDAIALGVELVGLVAGQKGEGVRAARLLGVVEAMRERIGLAMNPGWGTAVARMLAPVHQMLGDEAWALAVAAGHALGLEEAVAEALSEE